MTREDPSRQDRGVGVGAGSASTGEPGRGRGSAGACWLREPEFGGGDIFSLPGSIALGLIHPIAIILTSVFSVGFSASAIAGERQRGTLEVALARPIARRAFYLTLLQAAFVFVAITLAALLACGVAGATFAGVIGELPLRNVPLLWLNGFLLFGIQGGKEIQAPILPSSHGPPHGPSRVAPRRGP